MPPEPGDMRAARGAADPGEDPACAWHGGAPLVNRRRLGLSEGTVRTHLENIYTRLHVSSRTAAVTRACPAQAAV